MEVKYSKNITFSEARKIVESYSKDNKYVNVAQRASPVSNHKHRLDKYRALSENLMQLGSTGYPKFQDQL